MGRDIGVARNLADIEDIARAAMHDAGGGPLQFVGSVVNNFVELRGPALPAAASPRGLGNRVWLTWRKLMPVLSEIVVDSAEASSRHMWLIVFMALAIWSKLAATAPEGIGIDDATAMLALWRYRNTNDEISEDDGFARTNAVRAEFRIPPLAKSDFAGVIDRLRRLRCLSSATGIIRLQDTAELSGE